MLAEGPIPSSTGPLSGCVGTMFTAYHRDTEGGRSNPRETLRLSILGWLSPTPLHPQGALRPKAAAAFLVHHSVLDAS